MRGAAGGRQPAAAKPRGIFNNILLPSSTRTRFYPQRPSGQQPQDHGQWSHLPFLLPPVRSFIFAAQRVQHSHFFAFYACRFASVFANSRCRTFRPSYLHKDNSNPSYEHMFAIPGQT